MTRIIAYFYSTLHPRLTALCPGLPRWASTRKVKPIWILLKQQTVSGSGISWAICKSAPRSRQITMPVPHHSVFLRAGCPSCRPTNSVKALKAKHFSHTEMKWKSLLSQYAVPWLYSGISVFDITNKQHQCSLKNMCWATGSQCSMSYIVFLQMPVIDQAAVTPAGCSQWVTVYNKASQQSLWLVINECTERAWRQLEQTAAVIVDQSCCI